MSSARAWLCLALAAQLALAVDVSHRIARAQDDDTTDWAALSTRLARRSLRSPDDTNVLCQLGWAEYQTRAPEPARASLDHAIGLLGTPTEAALVRRLASCLYSRGRATEPASTADALPFYERSLALRPSATVQARLDGARRLVAAAWTHRELDPAPVLSDELAAAAHIDDERAQELDRFESAARDEIRIVWAPDEGDVVVVARRAGGAWSALAAWDDAAEMAWSPEDGGDDAVTRFPSPAAAWLEAPSTGEIARVVVVLALNRRMMMGSGPVLWAIVAVAEAGSLHLVSRDREGRSI